jgi:hypothetical protein
MDGRNVVRQVNEEAVPSIGRHCLVLHYLGGFPLEHAFPLRVGCCDVLASK